jgi:hypothetical protein
MSLDLEANEVEVKVLTSLALVTGITGGWSVKNWSLPYCSQILAMAVLCEQVCINDSR